MTAQRAHRRQKKTAARRSPPVSPELALASEQAFAIPAPETEAPESPSPGFAGTAEAVRASLATLRGLALKVGVWLRARTWEQWAWTVILALAATLRFWELGAKALHHDESMHAFYSLLFARDPSSYA